MHVSPAKHSYAWLSRKCDYRTDRRTHTQTDAGQSDPYVPLCFAGDTKIGVSIITFIINENKTWLSVEHASTSIAARVIGLQKCCQNTKCSFSLLYNIGNQVQGHFHLDKSIVSWKESLITTQCILFCPYYTWGMSKNKNKTAWPLFHYKSGVVVLSIYIRILFYFKIETNKKGKTRK